MQYTTYLRWGVVTGLFAALFVPFIIANGGNGEGFFIPISNMYFPYITGKNFIFRIIIEISLAFYILLALRDPKYRPRASYIMWAALALLAWMAVATIFSADVTKSFWSNFERMEGYVGLVHLFAFFVMAGAVLTVQDLWRRFFTTSVGVSAFMGVYALLQALELFGLHPSSQSGARADTSFGNAAYLAVYMLFNIFITLYLLATTSRQRVGLQIFYGLALVLQFAGLYLTQTRGALLGLVGGLVIAMIWIAWRAHGRELAALRKWSIGGLVVLVVLVGTFFVMRDTFKNMGGTVGRLASISLNDKTTRSRVFTIWPTAIKGGLERPVAGWGQENFSYLFNANYNPQMWDQEQWFDRAHNQFLDWLVAGGVPALLFYVSLFGLGAWAIIRSTLTVPEQAVMLGLLAGVALNNMLVFDNLMSSVYFFTILAFAHGLSRRELPGALWLSRPVGDHAVAIAAPLVIIALGVGGWALNAPGMARAQTLVDALSAAGNPAEATTLYQDALNPVWPGTGLGYQETTEQLINYAANSVAPSQTPSDLKQKYFELAQEAAEKLAAQRPGEARLELFLSGLYAQFGNIGEAVARAKRALELSPGKQQILFQLGLAQINNGDVADALTTFKQAYEAAPENDEALVWYVLGLYNAGANAAGDTLLVTRFGSTIVDNARLLEMYTRLKMHDRVIAIWKLRVEKNPKNMETNLALASAYFSAGRVQDTLAQLRQMMKDNPAQAAGIQRLIDQVTSGELKPPAQ